MRKPWGQALNVTYKVGNYWELVTNGSESDGDHLGGIWTVRKCWAYCLASVATSLYARHWKDDVTRSSKPPRVRTLGCDR